ncbi:transporter substrate-binding domain-containing protein [Cohnella fermenti]|uniref:Transporter substrate-binding domain-containing protein n=1 Tax=Cohnella fermenti TaxID=2565925 RepID=A0A4V3WG26_9BACL|nr:transporter substrate-binding domain-containing protein [Cohnella fermenti]THF82681.1 transporter substrate-binding domain-containing protein [Cohnella fermenti]
MKKRLIALTAVMALGVLGACGNKENNSASETPASTPSPSASQGKIVVGTSADYAPFEFHKTIDGKDTIVGFDIAIAKEIAQDLNAELVITDTDFDGLLLSLDTGKVDFVISGMNPTEERRKQVDFSDIYYNASQGVLVSKETADQYKTPEDLKNKKIGVQKGTIQEDLAKEIEGAQLTSLSKIPELVMEITSGRVDAVILEKPVAEQYAKTQSSTAVSDIVIEQPADETGFAIAVKKGDAQLVEDINETLKRLQDNGDIDRFVVEANELAGE